MFDEVIAVTNLERAWRQAVNWGKDYFPNHNAVEVENFQGRLTQELLVLQREIASGAFSFSPFHSLIIPKASGGTRQMAIPTLRDNIVIHALLNVIGSLVASKISPHSFAYRLAAQTASPQVYQTWVRSYGDYSSAVDSFLTLSSDSNLMKFDIESFYDSINQDVLLVKLSQLLSHDSRTLQLLERLIRYQVTTLDSAAHSGRGLPIGPAHSHLFANLYLSEVDSAMSGRVLGYARYVDDIVIVLSSSTDVRDAQRSLEETLGTLGLQLNQSKTRQAPVSRPQNVIDEVRKQKYRIGLLAHQEPEEEIVTQHIRDLFSKTLWDLEDVGEVSKVAPHMRFLLQVYKGLGLQQELVNIAYETLQSGIAEPSLCRLSTLFIIGQDGFQQDDRFKNLISEPNHLAQLALLRALIEEAGVLAPKDVLVSLTSSSHEMVRTLALAALYHHASALSLSQQEISRLLAYQSDYHAGTQSIVMAYGLGGTVLRTIPGAEDTVLPLLAALSAKQSKTSALAIIAFLSEVPSRKLLGFFWQTISDKAGLAGLPALLNSSLLSGDLGLVRRVIDAWAPTLSDVLVEIFRIAVRSAYQHAMDQEDLGLLMELANPQNWQFEDPLRTILQSEAVLNLREVVQSQEKPRLAQNALFLFEKAVRQDASGLIGIEGTSPVISVDGIRYTYGSSVLSSADSAVRVTRVNDENGQECYLETVNVSVLQAKGFAGLDSWKGYLRTQFNNGVTFRTTSTEYMGTVFTIYHVPEGFRDLASIYGQLRVHNEAWVFELIAGIGRQVESTKWAEGKFQSIGPMTVLVDVSQRVRFVALALACATPVYGIPMAARAYEDSPVAYQRHLAHIAAWLLFGREPEQRETGRDFLEGQGRKLIRPLRYIWLRLAEANLEYRYDAWDLACADIDAAKSIYNTCPTEASLSDELFHVAAYLSFRLSVTARNPRLRTAGLRYQVYLLAAQYFKEISQEGAKKALNPLTNPLRTPSGTVVAKRHLGRMLFAARLLVVLAEGFSIIYDADPRLRTVSIRNVALDLLLGAVWLEAEALAKGWTVLAGARDNQRVRELVSSLRNLSTAREEDYAKVLVNPTGVGLDPRLLQDVVPQAELRSLVVTLEGIAEHPIHEATLLNFSTTSQLAFLAWILLGRISLTANGSTTYLGLGKEGDARGVEWAQAFETVVGFLRTPERHQPSNTVQAGLREALEGFLEASFRVRPFKRRASVIVRYNWVKREGKVRYNQGLRLREDYFDHSVVGAADWEKYSAFFIPGTVDISPWPSVSDSKRGQRIVKVSLGPSAVVRGHQRGWKGEVHRFAEAMERGIGGRVARGVCLFAVVALFVSGFVWSFWLDVPSAFFFLLSVLWKWPEYWLFKSR